MTTEKRPERAEKANKEVNTEITFGSENILYGTTKKGSKCWTDTESIPSPPPGSPTGSNPEYSMNLKFSRPYLKKVSKKYVGEDETASKLEESKSDWMIKMKKIQELETMTRETLNEIQSQSSPRKTLENFKCRKNSKRSILVDVDVDVDDDDDDDHGDDYTKTKTIVDNNIESSLSSSCEEIGRNIKYESSSFDAITSRTEKLLGNVEIINRSSDDLLYRKNDFDYLKREDSRIQSTTFNNDDDDDEENELKSRLEFFKKITNSSRDFERDSIRRREESPLNKTNVDNNNKREIHTNVKTTTSQNKNSDISWQKYVLEKKRSEINVDFQPSKSNFNPFPTRTGSKPKDLGMKLGLYPSSPETQPKKV